MSPFKTATWQHGSAGSMAITSMAIEISPAFCTSGPLAASPETHKDAIRIGEIPA
jgi:hypothetical protein